MITIRDESRQQHESFLASVDADNQRIHNALEQYSHGALIGQDNDPTKELDRMGKFISAQELITRLNKLAGRDILIERNPTKQQMFVVYDIRGGQKKYIVAFENGVVPERTIMTVKRSIDVDPASLSPGWKAPKVNVETNDRGIIEIDENKVRPGLKEYRQPWHIVKMGYRTILVRLIQSGITSLYAAEEAFGSDSTPEWASKTGKYDKTVARF